MGLPDFPTGIILIVAQCLPPSSLMSLSHSCPKILNNMGVSVEHLHGKKCGIAQLSKFPLSEHLPKFLMSGWSRLHMAVIYHGAKQRSPKALEAAICSGP